MNFYENKQCIKRDSDERSKTRATRKKGSRSAKRKAYKKSEQQHEVRSFKDAFINVFLKDHTTFWQGIIIGACLYEFFCTRDVAWLFTALALVRGSSLPHHAKTLLPFHKESSQREDEPP